MAENYFDRTLEELGACEHEEAYQPPHECPFESAFGNDTFKCVCCEDCEMECYILSPES